MSIKIAFAALTLLVASAGAAFATDYYAAPPDTEQSCTANGSRACPWVGIMAGLESGKLAGGDRLLLLDGDYGGLQINDVAFDRPLVIQSLNGKNAHLDYITLGGETKNLTLRDLSFWPGKSLQPKKVIVLAYDHTSNIVADGLDVRGSQDAADYMRWTKTNWLNRTHSGILFMGPRSIIENSRLMGVYMGAGIGGANSAIRDNYIEGFSGDAYRMLGDNNIVSGNVAKNCFQIDGNHGDMVQSWTEKDGKVGAGLISGLTIENNFFLEWGSSQRNPLRCTMQGIGFFDGPYYHVIIRNNLISVTAYHGIAVYGGHNVQILNNTVVNNKGLEGKAPWIAVMNQKNGKPSRDILVANNLAMSFNMSAIGGMAIFKDNSELIGLRRIFKNIMAFDYRPTTASGFIDTADRGYAPPTDITDAARPAGAGPDRGAYEVGASGGTVIDNSGG